MCAGTANSYCHAMHGGAARTLPWQSAAGLTGDVVMVGATTHGAALPRQSAGEERSVILLGCSLYLSELGMLLYWSISHLTDFLLLLSLSYRCRPHVDKARPDL